MGAPPQPFCPAQEPSPPWEHPALGCQPVPLQDPALGSVTCWGSLPGPSVQGKGLFRAGPSLSLSAPRGQQDAGAFVGAVPCQPGARAALPGDLTWRDV